VLSKLHFLIHGHCYAEMQTGADAATRLRHAPFLAREQFCAARWRRQVQILGADEALAIVPAGQDENRPAGAFSRWAAKMLGERCLLLGDAPPVPDDRARARFNAGCHPPLNQEELETTLHCELLATRLQSLLAERGLCYIASTLKTTAMGASFEGCVLKYSLTLCHLLGLEQICAIDFSLAVPDAAFALVPAGHECRLPGNGIRLHLFDWPERQGALFSQACLQPGEAPAQVELSQVPAGVSVLNKQGVELWPNPAAHCLPDVPAIYAEPPQHVATMRNGCLIVPATSGYVYRLAKAPAYILAPPGMARAEFLAWLLKARYRGPHSEKREFIHGNNRPRFQAGSTGRFPRRRAAR
jgi:hypothetical protein